MDVDVEHPHVHHHRTGHHWIDYVVPVAALFVSLVSILIAYHHGTVMKELVHQNERLVRANSLPFLQLYGSNATPEGERRVSLVVANQGIGPAEVRTAEVLVDGKPQVDLGGVLQACCGGPRGFEGAVTSTLLGQMIRPGDKLKYIDLPATPENRAAGQALDLARRERIETRLCYCSVFDECWVVSSADSRPREAAQCPAVRTLYRQ